MKKTTKETLLLLAKENGYELLIERSRVSISKDGEIVKKTVGYSKAASYIRDQTRRPPKNKVKVILGDSTKDHLNGKDIQWIEPVSDISYVAIASTYMMISDFLLKLLNANFVKVGVSEKNVIIQSSPDNIGFCIKESSNRVNRINSKSLIHRIQFATEKQFTRCTRYQAEWNEELQAIIVDLEKVFF